MQNVAETAKAFKALSDEKRLRILRLLQNGEKCACVLIEQTGIPQSALSYHMKILCGAGIVKSRPDGKWMHYRIDEEGCERLMRQFQQLTRKEQEVIR